MSTFFQSLKTRIDAIWSTLAAETGAALIGFKSAGVGAVLRTIWARLNDLPQSVKNFGAVGDGITDDTAAVQAAITYVRTYNGELWFPRGSYLCTSALNIGDNITLVSHGSYNGGEAKIISTAAYMFKTPAGTFHAFNLLGMSLQGNNTNQFVDQSAGGSWAWCRVEGCYIVAFRKFYSMTTGVIWERNNFQNIGKIEIRGGDFSMIANYMGQYDPTSFYPTSDGFLHLISAGGFTIRGNYITSMGATSPYPVKVTGSSDGRLIDNWMDGGKLCSLSIEDGSHGIVATHNRITNTEAYATGMINISNVRNVVVEHNILLGLQTGQPIANVQSGCVDVVIQDNVTSTWGDTSIHDVYIGNFGNEVNIGQSKLKVTNFSGTAQLYGQYNGRTLTNTGMSGTVFWYVRESDAKAGNFINIVRTEPGGQLVIYDQATSKTFYNSSNNNERRLRLVCYVDGVWTVETIQNQTSGSAAPTTGVWLAGEIIWNISPAPSGFAGWICTTAGTVGAGAVFKTFGAISA